jgi:hypothetical protein
MNWLSHRAQDVALDLALDDFRHQAIHCTATGSHLLKHRGAIPVFLDRVLDAIELALNAMYARN